MWWGIVVVGSFGLAALPALLFLKNLRDYRVPSLPAADQPPREVSILIPARNEERGLRETLTAAAATTGVIWEVVVLDDHSTDSTPAIVAEFAARDPRFRLEQAPTLPAGWCGKQHACWVLSQRARYDRMLFLDADVQLAPTGVARSVAFLEASGAALVSGVPRQTTLHILEWLLIPLIHFVLLGFLPIARMRQSTSPAFGAGCGQFFLTTKAAYEQSGGHAAIRESLHDGVRLPRAYRQAGLMTDLFDATTAAVCRMYRTNGEVWRGLSKNATEGLAAPGMILPATVLLLGGQVAPWTLAALAGTHVAPWWVGLVAATTIGLTYVPRVAGAVVFRQSWRGAVAHPVAISVFLILQWTALARRLLGRPASWKAREYHSSSVST